MISRRTWAPGLLLAIVAIVASAAPSGAGGGESETMPIYDPDPTQKGAGKLDGETWIAESPIAALALTRIDDVTRTGFIRRRTGLDFDPFQAVPGHPSHYVTFHLLIENRGETRLAFQPGACRMETSYRDSESPIDYPTIITAFDMGQRAPPPDIGRIRGAILDGEIVLLPGEKRDGLLVYRTLDPRAKRYHVEVSATLTSGEAFGFTAHFKKRKP